MDDEKAAIICSYIAAYNNYDIDGMVAHLDAGVHFTNESNGEVNSETFGIDQFRQLAA